MKSKHVDAMKYYGAILIALCALLLINLGTTYLPLGAFGTPITLLLPVAMAVILMVFCMHLKTGDAITRIFAVAGFIWLALLFILSLADILTRAFVKPP